MSHAWEKFYEGARILAGEGAQRKRLIDAFTHCISGLRKEEFPSALQNEFEDLMVDVTREEAVGEEGTIQATIMKLSDVEISETIDRVLSLFSDLARLKR
ncbi:MAG: hypothetical protein O7H41_14285 [Planctomycetota bacterium]|nr:hypothetical protein [Planctomycetota bacterium]